MQFSSWFQNAFRLFFSLIIFLWLWCVCQLSLLLIKVLNRYQFTSLPHSKIDEIYFLPAIVSQTLSHYEWTHKWWGIRANEAKGLKMNDEQFSLKFHLICCNGIKNANATRMKSPGQMCSNCILIGCAESEMSVISNIELLFYLFILIIIPNAPTLAFMCAIKRKSLQFAIHLHRTEWENGWNSETLRMKWTSVAFYWTMYYHVLECGTGNDVRCIHTSCCLYMYRKRIWVVHIYWIVDSLKSLEISQRFLIYDWVGWCYFWKTHWRKYKARKKIGTQLDAQCQFVVLNDKNVIKSLILITYAFQMVNFLFPCKNLKKIEWKHKHTITQSHSLIKIER